MIVDIYVSADDADVTTRALAAWLGEDEPLRAAAQLSLTRSSMQDMGPVAEAVRVVLEPGGAVVALASAIGG